MVTPNINGVPSQHPGNRNHASTRTRYFSGSVDYTPLEKWTFSAGYTYNHQTTNTDMIVPVGTSYQFVNHYLRSARVRILPETTTFSLT